VKKSELNLNCAAYVKIQNSIGRTGNIACWEWGITSREDDVHLGDRERDGTSEFSGVGSGQNGACPCDWWWWYWSNSNGTSSRVTVGSFCWHAQFGLHAAINNPSW